MRQAQLRGVLLALLLCPVKGRKGREACSVSAQQHGSAPGEEHNVKGWHKNERSMHVT